MQANIATQSFTRSVGTFNTNGNRIGEEDVEISIAFLTFTAESQVDKTMLWAICDPDDNKSNDILIMPLKEVMERLAK